MTVKAANTICKHIQTNDTFYVDLGPILESGETVSSATAACTDTGMTVGTPAVLTSSTEVRDHTGATVTIEADTGVSVVLQSGTVGRWKLTIVATKSTGKVDCLECDIEVAGESA